MMTQLPCFWCLFLSCQQQNKHRKGGNCDVIKVLLILWWLYLFICMSLYFIFRYVEILVSYYSIWYLFLCISLYFIGMLKTFCVFTFILAMQSSIKMVKFKDTHWLEQFLAKLEQRQNSQSFFQQGVSFLSTEHLE